MKSTLQNYFFPLSLLWLFLLASIHICRADENTMATDEYALKSVCLYNFTQFTTWPGAKDLEKTESIVIGVVGRSPISDALDELQAWLRKANKKNITLVYHGPYHEGMDLTGNHVLFISSSEKDRMQEILSGLGDSPVLTVSDTEGFLKAGGMISLFIINNKVRWGINQKRIVRAGLQVSAKLLQLAIQLENHSGQSDFLHRLDRNNPRPFQEAFASLPHLSPNFHIL